MLWENIRYDYRSECVKERGVDMKQIAMYILKVVIAPLRLAAHFLSAIAFVALRISSIITGPVIALLGVLAVFCAAHQEWRNAAILLALGCTIYAAYFITGNLIARAGDL